MTGTRETWRLIFIAGSLVIVDQATKWMVVRYLPLHHEICLVDNYLNLTHVLNSGGAFGLLASSSDWVRKTVFLLFASLVAAGILWMYKKTAGQSFLWSLALALLFGGALGNLIDRFRLGVVIDFVDVHAGNLHWPAFNVADSAITMGMGIMAWFFLTNKLPDLS